MDLASFSLIPRRALQTWQMKLEFLETNRIFWSSKTPSSRNRSVTSGEVNSCLMQTIEPDCTCERGQTSGLGQWPSRNSISCSASEFTNGKARVIETELQEGFGQFQRAALT